MPAKQKSKHSKAHKYIARYGIDGAIRLLNESQVNGVRVTSLKVVDGYHGHRYALERLLFGGIASRMEVFLAKRPNIDFDHSYNLARKILYSMPSFKYWAKLITNTGSLAMEPLHNPEVKRLPSGHRLDPLTRRMFRHGSDPVGIRTRTVTAGWLAHHYNKNKVHVTWISLAGAYAGPSIMMIEAARIDKRHLKYVDIDANPDSIMMAAEVVQSSGLQTNQTDLINGDIFDDEILKYYHGSADVTEMMGIFEYLDDSQAITLLRKAYELLKPSGIMIICNMRESHPQLNLHKRGVGWPGVIPRTTEELINLLESLPVAKEHICVYQPTDRVYNVVCIEKD